MQRRLCLSQCKIFLVLAGFLLAASCTEKKAEEFIELSEEIVFTDTFTPFDWENPISRQILQSGDSDIGMFISQDVTDPGQRKTLQLIEQFTYRISRGKLDDIKELLTDPAYNSFMLRYPKISFSTHYTIRVEDKQQALMNQMTAAPQPVLEEDPGKDDNENWVRFKVMFGDKSLIGNVEVIQVDDTYKIGDFENDIFDELTAPKL